MITYTAPPGPPPIRTPWGMYRLLRKFQRDPTGVIANYCDKYGDMFAVPFGGTPRYVTRHPEHIREALIDKGASFIRPEVDLNITARYFRYCLGNGLLTSNGELWRRQRRMINPALQRKRIEAYAAIMVDHTERLLDSFVDGMRIEVSTAMTRLNVAILMQSLFDHGAFEQASTLMQLLSTLHKTFGTTSLLLLPAWLRLPGELRFRRSIARVDEIIYSMIEERRALGEEALAKRNDLLSALILATDDEATADDERRMTNDAAAITRRATDALSGRLRYDIQRLELDLLSTVAAPGDRSAAACRSGCGARRPPRDRRGSQAPALHRDGAERSHAPVPAGADLRAHGGD